MKKAIYALILPLVVVSGIVFANREIKKKTPEKVSLTPLAAAQRESERKQWEATPAGMHFKKWEASPAGQQVLAGAAKIRKQISDSSNMEAVITSLSLPTGSQLGFAVMARIEGVDYIVKFEPEKSQLEPLQGLKVNDKIIIKSRAVSYAPKYAYPIVWGDYAERDGNVIFKRIPPKGGC